MEGLIQSIADNARHRYDCLDDSEIIANTIIDLNDILQATQGSYKTKTLSNLLSYYLINSSVSALEKQTLAEEVGNIISTLDVLNSRSDALTLLQCAIDQELNK